MRARSPAYDKVVIGTLALLLTLACSSHDEAPRVIAGELDLTGHSFEANGLVTLEGDWRVCWGRLLEPGDTDCPGTRWAAVPVPGLWSEAAAASPFGGKGVATYRLRLGLPGGHETLLLSAGSPMTAYRLWIDGVPQGGAGEVGPTPETTTPDWRNRIFELPRERTRVELSVQVANFDFRGGGLRRLWRVGRPDQIQSQIGEAILRDAVLTIAALLVGLAFGLQFVLRPAEPARGYFGLFALVIGLRAIPGSISDFSQIITPWASFELIIRGEYLGTALAIFAGFGFFGTKVPGLMPVHLSRLLSMVALALAFICVVAPIPLVLGTLPVILVLPPLMLVIVFLSYGVAYRRGVPGVEATLVAAIVYAVVVGHDVIRTQTGYGAPLELFPYFFLIWLLSEAAGMLQTFFRSFSNIEDLSSQLLDSNFELQEDEAAIVRFVPFDVLRLLGKKSVREIASGESVRLQMTVACMRVHLVASTTHDESSNDSFRLINASLQEMEHTIRHSGGVVNYLGVDALLVLYPERANDAMRAAIEVMQSIESADAEEAGLTVPGTKTRVGIGIATGPLLLGIGGSQHVTSGPIGEAVEVARGIEALTATYGVSLLVAGSARDALDEESEFILREVDVVEVLEGSDPVTISEVLDAQAIEIREGKLASWDEFRSGRRALESGQFTRARRAFEECIECCDGDSVSRLLAKRAGSYESS